MKRRDFLGTVGAAATAVAIPPWFDRLNDAEQAEFLQLYEDEQEAAEREGELAPLFAPFGPAWLANTAPVSWHWHWKHQLALYGVLNKVRRGERKYVIITLPPRHTKTETASVRFPVYWLEQTPAEQVIIAGHTQPLADKISRKIRRLSRSRFTLSSERKAVHEWETEAGGGLRAVGVGVAVAGYGANLIFIDDPFKSRKEAESQLYRDRVFDWYTDDIYTRQEPECAIVIVMTRWHEDDLVGRILASEDGPNWTVINFPALALEDDPLGRKIGEALCPDRYDEEALARIRKVLGSYGFNSLYQGQPAPPEGGIFKRIWWNFWAPAALVAQLPAVKLKQSDGTYFEKHATALPGLPIEALSWDMAFKDAKENDFVCGGAWGKERENYYLLDMTKGHLDFPATVAAFRDMKDAHPRAVAKWVEDKANGPAVIQSLRSEISGIIAVEPEGGKIARAHAEAPLVESGNVFLPHPALANTSDGGNWVTELIDSCANFPNAAHDDDVDMLTQALAKLRLIRAEAATYKTRRAHA